jgi:LemA protein
MNDDLVPLMLFGAVAIFGVAWLAISVNGLKQLALVCDESWSDVVHDLGRRHELVPKLVETARPLLSEHIELLDGMLRASQEAQSRKAPPGERGLDESAVSVTLQRLLVLVEQRPTLKQDEGFQRLRKQLVEVEEHLQSSRRSYNTNAKDLNRRGQSFPVNLLAGSEATARRDAFELLPVGLAASNGNGRG